MDDPLLTAKKVRRIFGSDLVLDGIDLDLYRGEFLVILGPSGCGKTTLLNILAGFDDGAEYEQLELDDTPITGGSPDIAVIFQEDSLFPWLTLRQNIEFGDRVRDMPADEREEVVNRFIVRFHLGALEEKYPDQLSGGQRQRAAVARALINHPRLLLADEPFRALDSQTRITLQAFLWNEIRSRNQTLCLITHDIDEALFLGDRLVILGDRPTTVRGEFTVEIVHPRTTEILLSDGFQHEKKRFVGFCNDLGLPLFPRTEEGRNLLGPSVG